MVLHTLAIPELTPEEAIVNQSQLGQFDNIPV